MVGVSLRIDPRDMEAVFRRISVVLDFNAAELHAEWGEEVVDQTLQRFRDQVDPDGSAWEPSARASNMQRGKTLIRTSRLMRSITYRADADAAVVGTNAEYAAAHQDPARRPDGRLKRPRRAFLGLTDANRDELRTIALEHLGAL